MNRLSDIKIIIDRGCDRTSERLQVNSGTVVLERSGLVQSECPPNAFVPKQDWRTLNSAEIEQSIISNDRIRSQNIGEYIGIIRVPNRLISPLSNLAETIITDPERCEVDVRQVPSHPEYRSILKNISTYLQKYAIVPNEIVSEGIFHCNRLGLVTCTREGLHVDSWEKAPLRRRHLSKNRLCINIGRENRYFLFIDLSLMKMLELLQLSTAIDISRYYRGAGLSEKFMETFPDYPVTKLALNPGEAYMAPTENIIHDSSSLDKQELDFSLTFLGKFEIPSV
ncbi:hypothetical protein [Chamaesiphon sp. VAR_48_metabat_135_sub]|uniref:hypothetical protein n=1 Tax=Chamaesiphon sp. VAR_48_metabat_135_sub TaxID=2964699 RepID=UPI00286A169C|nr:hypothetical protein [Chamaesiphon sp. VAR_48_metabat_135_sub]